jgi:hypothetical protein
LYDYIQSGYNKHGNKPLHKLMNRAMKKAGKFGVKPDELDLVKIHFNQMLKNKGVVVNDDRNEIAKKVGHILPSMVSDVDVRLSDKDQTHMDVIRQIHNTTKLTEGVTYLHNHTYDDVSDHLMQTRFNPFNPVHGMNIHNFLHPVLVALFAPKIRALENRFIISNLASTLVDKERNNQIPFRSLPDIQLFHAMTQDPNHDLACDSSSVWGDLQQRCEIQAITRYCVNQLRNGVIYDPRNTQFLNELNSCRMSAQDSPSLVMTQDESVVLIRLFAAWSFRPTTIRASTQMGTNVYPGIVQNHEMHNLSAINVYLPPKNVPVAAPVPSINLTTGFSQPQFVLQNGLLSPRTMNIMHTDQVLVFQVHRRETPIKAHHMPGNFFVNNPIPMSMMPHNMINDTEVDFDLKIPASQVATSMIQANPSDFYLRSVVVLDVNPNDQILPTGGSTVLFKWTSDEDVHVYAYRPLKVVRGMKPGMTGPQDSDFRPFIDAGGSALDDTTWEVKGDLVDDPTEIGGDTLSMMDAIKQRGSIFIYAQKVRDPYTGEMTF